MSESKEEVVSIESRPSHGPHADYPRLLDPDVSESEGDEETADLAVRSVSPFVNRSAPDLLSHVSFRVISGCKHRPCLTKPPATSPHRDRYASATTVTGQYTVFGSLILTFALVSMANHPKFQDDSNLPHLDRPRVRFRSRVRISAGIGHRRQRLSEGLSSNASSISGSPSSSISAPLRTHYTGSNNGWGPLGTRVSLLASQAAVPIPPRPRRDIHKSIREEDGDGNAQRRTTRRSNSWMFIEDEPDERTHLMTSAQRRRAAANGHVHGWYYGDGERERKWREQLVDEAFGKWPQRVLNRDWWWWQLEPLVCCFCICGGLDEAE